mmetsp:Transcript_1492/g.4214  ORF Transcript_1492/g.4214 Transcript_1492/m.4214 type:complete len:203 (+) Transcript_1492:815-1423(+)
MGVHRLPMSEDVLEDSSCCSHREWMTRTQVYSNATATIDAIHYRPAACKASQRIPAAERLPVAGQIAAYAEFLLRTARSHTEASHHLVEHEYDAMLYRPLSKLPQKVHWHAPRVAILHWLAENSRNVGMTLVNIPKRSLIVILEHNEVSCEGWRDSRRDRHALLWAGAIHRASEETIKMAVIRAVEHYDLATARVPTAQATG